MAGKAYMTPRADSRTSKGFGLLSRHRAQVLQVALVPDEHDDDIRVCVVAQLLEPARHVHVCRMLGDIVYE